VALHRPIFGHGLGASREANANFGMIDQLAHNLYAEVAQELGFIGLLIFVYFIKSVATNFVRSVKKLRENSDKRSYLLNIGNAMQIWLFMNFMFSFASYGLSSYEWYLFGGLSVVIKALAENKISEETIK
jgi:O-antigen ligase